jgi:hypothetical protein
MASDLHPQLVEPAMGSRTRNTVPQLDDAVREVVFPAVTGGEQTLRELVHEFTTNGRCTGSRCRPHCGRSTPVTTRCGLIALLGVPEFRSNNTARNTN